MIGKKISHYQILKKLDESNIGVVYKDKDIKLNCDVVIKL